MIRFGIIWFGLVNDTEASVFGYSVFTRFVRPLVRMPLVGSGGNLPPKFFRIYYLKGHSPLSLNLNSRGNLGCLREID